MAEERDSESAYVQPLCGDICVSRGRSARGQSGKMFEPRSGGTGYDTDTVRTAAFLTPSLAW